MNFRTNVIIILLCFLMSPAIYAGDIKKIHGEAHRFSPHTESPEEARRKAIQEAQIDALAKAFNVSVSERTIHISDTHDGHTTNLGRSVGESEVNGDWLRNLKDPDINVEPVEHGNIYHVKVYGEARERKFNKIDVDCRLLCNGTDPDKDRLRGEVYYEGDELYVYFVSPVDGWLAIYLIDDDEERTTQCLVPYDNQREPSYPIRANQEYVFFSKRTAEPQYVDNVTRMITEARKKMDLNDLYVIFSPNQFSKASSIVYKHSRHHTNETEIQADLMPRETTFERFDKWLTKQRRQDADLQSIPISFSISKK